MSYNIIIWWANARKSQQETFNKLRNKIIKVLKCSTNMPQIDELFNANVNEKDQNQILQNQYFPMQSYSNRNISARTIQYRSSFVLC